MGDGIELGDASNPNVDAGTRDCKSRSIVFDYVDWTLQRATLYGTITD